MNYTQDIGWLCDRGVNTATKVDAGQAEQPIADHFQMIKSLLDGQKMPVVILEVTPGAAGNVISGIRSEQCAISLNALSQYSPLTKLTSEQDGLFIADNQGGCYRYSDAGQLQSDKAGIENIVSTRCVPVLNCPVQHSQSDPLDILVVSSRIYSDEHLSFLSQITTHSNFLIIAGESSQSIDESIQSFLGQIIQNMDGLWPIIFHHQGTNEALPGTGWWSDLPRAQLTFQGSVIDTANMQTADLFPSDYQTGPVGALRTLWYAKKLSAAIDMLNSHTKDLSDRVYSRLKREDRKIKALQDNMLQDSEIRKIIDHTKNGITDAFTAMTQMAREMESRNISRDQMNESSLGQYINNVNFEDLEKEEGYKLIKLALSDDYKQGLLSRLSKEYAAETSIHANKINEKLKEFSSSISAYVQEHMNQHWEFQPELIDTESLYRTISEEKKFEVRYRGEMNKRGAFQRLMEGRKAVFGIIIFASIFGRMFESNMLSGRYIGTVLLIIFIGAILYSFIGWKKEDKERIEKELDRVKDGILSEVSALQRDLDRRRETGITQHLQEQQKRVSRQFQEYSTDLMDEMRRGRSGSQDAARQHMKTLQAEQNRLNNYLSESSTLQADISTLIMKCTTELSQPNSAI